VYEQHDDSGSNWGGTSMQVTRRQAQKVTHGGRRDADQEIKCGCSRNDVYLPWKKSRRRYTHVNEKTKLTGKAA